MGNLTPCGRGLLGAERIERTYGAAKTGLVGMTGCLPPNGAETPNIKVKTAHSRPIAYTGGCWRISFDEQPGRQPAKEKIITRPEQALTGDCRPYLQKLERREAAQVGVGGVPDAPGLSGVR